MMAIIQPVSYKCWQQTRFKKLYTFLCADHDWRLFCERNCIGSVEVLMIRSGLSLSHVLYVTIGFRLDVFTCAVSICHMCKVLCQCRCVSDCGCFVQTCQNQATVFHVILDQLNKEHCASQLSSHTFALASLHLLDKSACLLSLQSVM